MEMGFKNQILSNTTFILARVISLTWAMRPSFSRLPILSTISFCRSRKVESRGICITAGLPNLQIDGEALYSRE